MLNTKFVGSQLSITFTSDESIVDEGFLLVAQQGEFASVMSVGSRGQGGPWPPWIFIHGTDKVQEGLMVLFFGLVFFSLPSPKKFFCRRLWLLF